MRPEIVLIAARARNGVIGRDNALPWHIPADLKRFKRLTMGPEGQGLPMIMGRKTFDSLPGLLPGRRHIVLTRAAHWQAAGAERADDVDDALRLAGGGTVTVIGGAQVYRLFLPLATRIELTEVHADVPGDTHFPPLGDGWHESLREDHPALGEVPAHSFVTLERA
ncbi:MAG: dihydrofolate reductase [Novosphingobium sp.]